MTFAETRALIREITTAAVETSRVENIEVKCVVVTREQYGALLATLERPRLDTKFGHLALLCDEDLGKPLPDGQWQILEFIPRRPNQVARDLIGDVLVSTIDLAANLDENAVEVCFPAGEERYETSVLHAEDDAQDRTRRYYSLEAAREGHAAEVERERAKAAGTVAP